MLSSEEIRSLIVSGGINDYLKKLDDPKLIYQIIREEPSLITSLNSNLIRNLIVYFNSDFILDKKTKMIIFKHLLSYFDYLPAMHAQLIDDRDYYLSLAGNLGNYSKLCGIYHPFKKEEQELFRANYEDNYVLRYDDPVPYAKGSSKVLLNTLKNSSSSLYLIGYFQEEAFNNEVINYLVENKLIDQIDKRTIMKFSKLCVCKLRSDLSFLYELPHHSINDDVITYLRAIHFSFKDIPLEYLARYKELGCFKSSKFMELLLFESVDFFKYYTGDDISSSLIDVLLAKGYVYKSNDNPLLLADERIRRNLIQFGDINLLFLDYYYLLPFNKHWSLSSEEIDLLIERIKRDNLDIKFIETNSLPKRFYDVLKRYYDIKNPYNLEDRYVVSNLGRALEKGLAKIFSKDVIDIIIREIVKNDYYLDMLSIIENIDLTKLGELYTKLYYKEQKFNREFSYVHFIKVMEYFANNLGLLKEIAKSDLDDDMLTNLSLTINNNDKVDVFGLENYQNIVKKRVMSDNLDSKDQFCQLLVGANSTSVQNFLNKIGNSASLIYLQLEFQEDRYIYQVIEGMLSVVGLLEKVLNGNVPANEILAKIYKDFQVSSFFKLDVMKANLLEVYRMMYQKEAITTDGLRAKGKSEIVDGKEIFDLTGESFIFYTHSENFNNQGDFTDIYQAPSVSNNYICTTMASKYNPQDLARNGTKLYELADNKMIAFGKGDIYIEPTKKPLYKSNDIFANSLDVALNKAERSVANEFDFLRTNNQGKVFTSTLVVYNSKEEALRNYSNKQETILVFDPLKHQKICYQEMLDLKDDLSKLSYKDMYRLIAVGSKWRILDDIVLEIVDNLERFSDKEKYVLIDALKRYDLGEYLVSHDYHR